MANKFTRFLTDVFTGVTNPKGRVANYQHATRLFIDDNFRLAPKTKFNFYVRFELDNTAHGASNFTNKHINEVGLLVKNVDLPSFSFDSEVLEQYNRKKLIYKRINYDPVNFSFHDDNQGVISALWAIYYGYYIRDRHLSSSAFSETKYMGTDDPRQNFRYGLDNNKTTDLLKSVTIFTMGRRRFIGYTLVNPRIKSWKHGQHDYSLSSEPAQSDMSLEYEAVRYSSGTVSEGSPKGFATLHYDNSPSPLSVAGGGVSNLIGEGGVLDGLEQVFGAIGDGTAFSSPQGFLSTAIAGINTFKNAKALTKDGLKGEAINILTSPAGISAVSNTINGVVGAAFPKNRNTTAVTKANPKKMIGGT